MKTPRALFAFSLFLAAAGYAAAGSDTPHWVTPRTTLSYSDSYQAELLKRDLSSRDKEFCEGLATDQEKKECKVTIPFIADIKGYKEKGFPTDAKAKYGEDKNERLAVKNRIP